MKKELYKPPHGFFPQIRLGSKKDFERIKNTRKNIKRKPHSEMNYKDVLVRWPSLVAHLICVSLGYCTPGSAARIILDHINKKENSCEWIQSCYNNKPTPPIQLSWKCRHNHKNYMSNYKKSLELVFIQLITGNSPTLASWF